MKPFTTGHHTYLMKALTTIEKVKEIKRKNKDENIHQHFKFFHFHFSAIATPVFVPDTEPLYILCSGCFCLNLLNINNDKEIKSH
jgi:hypothetical protein